MWYRWQHQNNTLSSPAFLEGLDVIVPAEGMNHIHWWGWWDRIKHNHVSLRWNIPKTRKRKGTNVTIQLCCSECFHHERPFSTTCGGERRHRCAKDDGLVNSKNRRWSPEDSSWPGPLETRHVQPVAEFKVYNRRRAPFSFIWRLNWEPQIYEKSNSYFHRKPIEFH